MTQGMLGERGAKIEAQDIRVYSHDQEYFYNMTQGSWGC